MVHVEGGGLLLKSFLVKMKIKMICLQLTVNDCESTTFGCFCFLCFASVLWKCFSRNADVRVFPQPSPWKLMVKLWIPKPKNVTKSGGH